MKIVVSIFLIIVISPILLAHLSGGTFSERCSTLFPDDKLLQAFCVERLSNGESLEDVYHKLKER